MRLQVAVLRHDLPEVRFIYNTASKHGPGIARPGTIADLISAVNALVPIESPDGEWGLEDYVVEVAATADQAQTYECFHFQEINDVLKEDDEVIIRGLTTEDLRHRRQGGRLQITRDGRHLIDGLSWGRRWRAGVSIARPDFSIPPRKRRRIMREPEPEPRPDEEIRLELEYPSSRQLVPFVNGEEAHADEDEDEDDEDYQDIEDEERRESDEEEEEPEHEDIKTEEKLSSNQGRQVIAKATFEDADSVDEDEGDEDLVDGDIDGELSEGAEYFTAELEALTNDAGTTAVNLNRPRRTRSETFFEEFPSPLIRPELRGLNGVDDSAADTSQLVEEAHETSNTDMFVFKGRNGGDTVTAAQIEVQVLDGESEPLLNGVGQDKSHPLSIGVNDDGENGVSSSDDESSEEDSSDDSSSSDSEAESSSDEEDDSSEESSDEHSDSGESTSISDSSLSSVRSTTKPASPIKLGTLGEKPQNGPPKILKTSLHKNNPPGTGQNKTKRNNERKRLSKLLSNLKEAGKLGKDADFKALREYLAGATEEVEQQKEVDENENENENQAGSTQDKISARAEEILARLNKVEDSAIQTSQDVNVAITTSDPQNDGLTDDIADLGAPQDEPATNTNTITRSDSPIKTAATTAVMDPHKSTNVQQESEKTSAKRAQLETDGTSSKRVKLDVAASRRMLFNSLGVRNPKTAEAENALREKLAKPVRQIKNKELEMKEERMLQAPLSQDRWRKKFRVLAVECVQDWKRVDVPPFPFKQPWQVRQEKAEMARTTRRQETYEGNLNYDDVEEDQDTQPMDIDTEPYGIHPSQSMTTSRTLTVGTSAEDDDIPEPSDFSILPALTESNVSRAAVIAYKELHMNARFEPEQSSYRVARVVSHVDNTLRLRVMPRYRRQANTGYEKETRERQYNRFEVPIDEDEEPDDGFREVEFSQMINPKIVTLLNVHDDCVAQDARQDNTGNKPVTGESSLRGGHLDTAVQHLSQTLENNNVSTPRRAEINTLIKEAGFNSAVDGQLLQGLTEAAAQDESPPVIEDDSIGDIDAARTLVWQSDALQPTSPAQGTADTSAFRESSVPSESMVESVKYPHLSELEVDTPMPAQSSSHQDAQKPALTPLLPPEDSTNLEFTIQEATDQLDDPEPDSLPSEVPQTQSQDFIPDSLGHKRQRERDSRALSASPLPDIGPNLDGSSSPRPSSHADPDPDNRHDHDHDQDDANDESIDSNGFPSIRSLTSSQAHHPTTADATDKKTTVSKMRHSPPEPTRRSPRTRKATARSSDWSDTETPPQPQPSTSFKASQSQAQRLSQIPEDTIFVDLTQSSPAVSPDKDKGKEKEVENEKATEMGTRRTTKDKEKGDNGGDGKGPSNIFRKSFEGLGEKSYLKRKKKSL